MQKADLISAYAEALAREVSLDRALSRRLREEVEDHLREALAATQESDTDDAARRVIDKFGDARLIAADFAPLVQTRRIARLALALIVAVAIAFIAMKARLASYPAAGRSGEYSALAGLIISIDRYAFWAAAGVGIIAWAYIDRIARNAVHANGRRLWQSILLCIGASAALVLSIACDALLTGLRVFAGNSSGEILIPLATILAEIGCAAFIGCRIAQVLRRSGFRHDMRASEGLRA
jgi:hypothetical protein